MTRQVQMKEHSLLTNATEPSSSNVESYLSDTIGPHRVNLNVLSYDQNRRPRQDTPFELRTRDTCVIRWVDDTFFEHIFNSGKSHAVDQFMATQNQEEQMKKLIWRGSSPIFGGRCSMNRYINERQMHPAIHPVQSTHYLFGSQEKAHVCQIMSISSPTGSAFRQARNSMKAAEGSKIITLPH